LLSSGVKSSWLWRVSRECEYCDRSKQYETAHSTYSVHHSTALSEHPSTNPVQQPNLYTLTTPSSSELVDLTIVLDGPGPSTSAAKETREKRASRTHMVCCGLIIDLYDGINPYLRYPFGLHGEKNLPWNVKIERDRLVVQAWTCTKRRASGKEQCQPCQALLEGGYLPGIVERMNGTVHENTPLAYHGTAGLIEVARRKDNQIKSLRFTKLTTERLLAGISGQLDDAKRLHVAIASGKVKNVHVLLRVALNHKRNVRTILRRYCDAAAGVYSPRDMSEEAVMQGILLWRLGGVRIAEFAHLALGLPSLSVLRRQSTVLPIMPSPIFPIPSEVEVNVCAVFTDGLLDALKKSDKNVLHLVLMLDELATEKRPRWDDRTNNFLGLCREHGHLTSTTFTSEQDLDDMMESVKKGQVHYASEVRIKFLMSLPSSNIFISSVTILGNCCSYWLSE
jgi:hypothetical protein